MLRPFSRVLFLPMVSTAIALANPAAAQCTTQWLPGQPLAGTNDEVLALTEWDPDGSGPGTPVVVVGGRFTVAGAVVANRIATYDPATQTWASLGAGVSGIVQALAVLQNGDLVAAGAFSSAGGAPASRIARWNGTSWSPLGAGVNGTVLALTTLLNGNLVAGGVFTSAGGVAASCIAQWDGAAWSPVGQGVGNTVEALTTLPNGDLVAGGQFTTAGGLPANRIARWDGTTWSRLGTGALSMVREVLAMPNGDVVAAGFFQPSVAVHVARWDGNNWTMLGAGLTSVEALARLPNGDIVATGSTIHVRRWNGTAWSVFGTIEAYEPRALAVLQNGDLVAGGAFRGINGVAVDFISIWNGATWSPTAPWAEGRREISALVALPDGDVLAGVSSALEYRVRRWDGATWLPVGAPFDGAIRAMLRRPNGDIVATGGFTTVGGVVVNGIASWNGTSWQPLGAGLGAMAPGFSGFGGHALLSLPNGHLLVGGSFAPPLSGTLNRVARWDGTSWTDFGAGLSAFIVTSLALLPGGEVVAGSMVLQNATPTSQVVFRRSGATWSQLGSLLGGSVNALAVLPSGDLVAGGMGLGNAAGPMNCIARWDGQSWNTLGTGVTHTSFLPAVRGLAVLPGGDLVASGLFASAGGAPAAGIARWNGTAWSALATATAGGFGPLALHALGDVLIGGSTTMVDGVVADRLARLTTTCPASAFVSGTGCTGSDGTNVLVAETLPWLGSTHRVIASGLSANALALHVFGTTTVAIPLAAIVPQGQPACSLLVSPDALSLLLPLGGTAQFAFAIPSTPSLVGAVFHEQVVPIELDASGGIVALTATDSLALVIGAF